MPADQDPKARALALADEALWCAMACRDYLAEPGPTHCDVRAFLSRLDSAVFSLRELEPDLFPEVKTDAR